MTGSEKIERILALCDERKDRDDAAEKEMRDSIKAAQERYNMEILNTNKWLDSKIEELPEVED